MEKLAACAGSRSWTGSFTMCIINCVVRLARLGPVFRAFVAAGMVEIINDPFAQLIIWSAFGAGLVVLAVYVVKKIRDEPAQHEPSASQLLSKFRDLHGQGHLTDAEFRTIKTALADRIQDEIKDNGETG